MVLVLGLALDVFAQVIVIDPVSGGVKDIIIMPLPAPTRWDMAYINPSALQNIQPGGYYPVNNAQFGALQTGAQAYPNINSDDPSDWGEMEQMKMFVWFMKTYHEEDIKGFKAMRDIERSIEREEQLERERQYLEMQQRYLAQQQAMQAQAAQNSYTYTTNAAGALTAVTLNSTPTKRPLWKRLLNKI